MKDVDIDSIVMGVEEPSIDSIVMDSPIQDVSIDDIVLGPDVKVAPATVAPMIVEPKVAEKTIQEKMASAYLHPELKEYDKLEVTLKESIGDSLKSAAKEVGMEAIATSELAMGLASGMLLYIPSKLYGVMALPFGREVANIAEEEMAKLGYQPQIEGGKEALEMVGKGFEWFLSPARKVGEMVSELSPRLGYLAEFGAELAEFVMTGGIVKGVRAKFKPTIENAQRLIEAKRKLETDTIAVKEKTTDLIPDEILKNAQRKVLEVEKVQAELEAKSAMEKLDYGQMIKQDLSSKTTQIEKIKQPARDIADVQIDRALEKVKVEAPKASVEPIAMVKGIKDIVRKELGDEVAKNLEYDMKIFTDDGMSEIRAAKATLEMYRDLDKHGMLNLPDDVLISIERKVPGLRLVEPKPTDLDLQTGARDPVDLKSIFDETLEKTNQMKQIYGERVKNVNEDVELFTGKSINDVNRWRHGDDSVNIEDVRGALSELAARSDELKYTFAESEGFPANFESWKVGVEEAASWARKADRLKIEPPGVTLAVGIPLDKAAKDIVAGARKVAGYTRMARGMKAFKPTVAAKMLRDEFNRSFVDRSGNIRIDLLDKLGEEGYRIIQKMYLSKGASSISANMLRQMKKEVYGGLSKIEKKILDDVILDDRMLDIGKYKTEKQFKHPKGVTLANFAENRELFQYKSANELVNLTSERAAEISRRSKAYFEWMKKPLKDMLDAELITEQEYTDLISHNYRRIKLVEVYDKVRPKPGKKGRSIYDSGIEALARGRETDIYEPSSEIMALEVFNRAYGRILNNEANKSLVELARKDPTNSFARIRTDKGEKIPTGWHRFFAYEKGERKSVYLSPEMSKEWITSNPEMTYRISQIIRHGSLSPVLRTFATGINWGFAIANLPRDVMHTWFTARMFQDSKWKSLYSSHLPVFGLQIGRDLATVFSDAALKKGRYQSYMDEGGGMEFLVHQGRLFQRGRHLEGNIDKIYDFLGYFGETTEVMTRLAIRERVIKRRAKEQGLTMEQAKKNKDITREATFAARDYMDFGQGGGIAKALDNGIPYLNAAIQGTRGLFRSFKPGSGTALSSTYKLAQLAAVTTGIYVAMQKMHPKTSEALRGNIDMQNNLCLPLGDDFGFEDERGQIRYPYLKWPLDPGQKFFKTFFEACSDKWLGREVDVDRVIGSLKQFSPVGTTTADILPPSVSSTLGYVTNKDFWLNEDIWRKGKPFSYELPVWAGGPEIGGSKEEFVPGVTPQVYKDFGQLTGLSPERIRYMVEEVTTSGTLWSYLLGQGYDVLFDEMPKNMKEQHLAMVLSKIPVVKRFFGVTNPYSKHAGPIEKAEEESTVKRWIQNRGLDMRVNGYLFEDNVSRKEIFDYIKEFKDSDVQDRLLERFTFSEMVKDLPERTFWLRLKSLPPDARARVYSERLEKATLEERMQIKKELGTVIAAGGFVSDKFLEEVGELQRKKILEEHLAK